jgi:fatty-acyl-CoA synthase
MVSALFDPLAPLAERYAAVADEERTRWDALSRANVTSFADAWELAVDRYAERPVVHDVGAARATTYAELDADADRVAAWALSTEGDAPIGVRMPNGAAFLATVIGLAKAGKLAVLLGTPVPPPASAELARGCGVRTVIGEALPGLEHASPHELFAAEPPGRPARSVRRAVTLDDPVVIIFTSGTTGRSKPALFSHRRMIGAGVAWAIRTGMTAEDRCYITLPLSHGNGLAVAFSSVMHAGGAAIVRERFSVRSFLPDVRAYRCTATVYIGELWRYLDSMPAQADDADTSLSIVFGNGLHGPLWDRSRTRFGIRHVVEHYGATELPAGALTNWTGRAGYCGFIPPDHPDANDVLLVDEAGREVASGAPGEALIRVTSGTYRGYLDPALDEARLWRDVRAKGDVWWRSGDLLTRDAEGFFTFVDRIGDSFRWRGENVSSSDVEEAIVATGLVEEAVVFGVRVPGEEGKVGMASLVAREGARLDLEAVREALARALPPYAIPLFVREVPERHPTTGTLKIQKKTLADAPFALVDSHPHAILRDGRYVPLDAELLEAVRSERVRLRPGLGVIDVR